MSEDKASPFRCSRVHFPTEQVNLHNSHILVNESKGCENCIDIHVGFLQIHHEYRLEFDIKDNLGEELTHDPLQSLNVHLISSTPTTEGHSLQIHFKAEKEKLIAEEFMLESKNDSSKVLKLILHARVLGKGKGTPALKNGVHMLKRNHDTESRTSED